MLNQARPGCQAEDLKVTLVPLGARHATSLATLAGVDPGPPWTATPEGSALQNMLAFVARAQRLRARGARETFAVCETRRLVGIAVLARDPAAPDRAEIGYWIGPPYRGHGYATAAARHLLGHAFGRTKLALVFARCASTNRASVRILEKLGVRFIGSEPGATPSDDPVGRYELTRHEWRHPGSLLRPRGSLLRPRESLLE